MKITIEVTEQELKDLKLIRNYFGEHDKTQLEHLAYSELDKLVKKLQQADVIKLVCHCGNESVEEYYPSCSLKCTLCRHEETENIHCEVGWSIEGKRCKKCKQTVL